MATMLTALLLVSLFYLTALRGRTAAILPKPSANEFVSTVSALPVSPFTFGRRNFASLAPATVSLYLEGSNPRLFLEKRLVASERSLLETKVGLNLDEITSFFEPEFAYLEASSSAAIVGVGKDPEFLRERAARLSGPSVKAEVLDEYFVAANSASLLKDIEAAYKKTTLPLTLTAKFQELVRRLPESGQLFIYGESQSDGESALRYYFGSKLRLSSTPVSGTSFVVSAVSGSTVIKGLNASPK